MGTDSKWGLSRFSDRTTYIPHLHQRPQANRHDQTVKIFADDWKLIRIWDKNEANPKSFQEEIDTLKA